MSITIHPHEKAAQKMKTHRTKHLWPEPSVLPKPTWLKKTVRSGENIDNLIALFKKQSLVTVCQEASCPNLVECFDKKIATFMIMGSLCTRRCSFCDVGHGRPEPLDPLEPLRLAQTIHALGLRYVVITSVDRDDLLDGGASHFVQCLKTVRQHNPQIVIECLVPDFRGRHDRAFESFTLSQPDVFNHNLETVKALYSAVRPGSDYDCSLNLLARFKRTYPHILTKSGIMLGLGETREQLEEALQDLLKNGTDSLTLGQYLPPSSAHYPLMRYVSPEEFADLKEYALKLGFVQVASGPFVRSSYHAEEFAAQVNAEK
jgi:lipoic acid synthetase